MIRFIVLHILKIEPYSDYATLFNAAWNLKDGINVMADSPYFNMWGFQTGYVLYQTVLLKIFQSEMALHVFDCFYTSASCTMIYLMGKDLWKSDQKLPSFLYAIYLFAIAYTGVLSNQHLYVFLVLIAIWLWLREREKSNTIKISLIVGVLLAIANIIRPEVILVLSAMILYEFLKIETKEDWKKWIKKILILLGTFLFLTQTASFLVQKTGLNPSGLENKNILWKFVCGSDYEVGGGYSLRGEPISNDQEAEKQFILDNYTSLTPSEWLIFFKKKINNFWTNDSYGWVSATVGEEKEIISGISMSSETIIQIVKIVDGMGYLVIFFLALVSMAKARKENDVHSPKNFFLILLLLHFLVYLVIETQTRYAYLARILLFILAMDGMKTWKEDQISQKMKNWMKEKGENIKKKREKAKLDEKKV